MSGVAERLKEQLAVLTPEDRAELLEFLEQSFRSASLVEREAEWDAELERRKSSIERGETVGTPWERVSERRRSMHG
jgi:putative addiction module component (TIGR02574 family)